jgi:gliding motility-associated-like protein
LNDLFRLPDYERADMTLYLEVYDRWGEKIYSGVGPEAAWDGTIGGKAAPAEAYVWRLAVKCGDAEALKYGDVTLLR